MKRASIALLILLSACTSDVVDVTSVSSLPPEESRNGITARLVADTWIFSHNPNGGADGLHGGFASIVDGCLLVDGAVVIWHEDDIVPAGDLIAAVHAGERPNVSVGGGGVTLAEGGDVSQFPGIILDRCSTDTIWYASGD